MPANDYLFVFMDKASLDGRIMSSHICLFTALYQSWRAQAKCNPFKVTRKELMRVSKIASTSTYHRCMTDLHALGFIRYLPSYHPLLASRVYFNVLRKE